MAREDKAATSPGRQAQRILAAWTSGDEALLQKELRTIRESSSKGATGLEQERFELLQAISESMLQTAPILSSRKEPAMRRCLELLEHLASTPGLSVSCRPRCGAGV